MAYKSGESSSYLIKKLVNPIYFYYTILVYYHQETALFF
ncbi:hypothetical protein SK137_0723 [Streptococcus mitis]|uniref:Uncharacterized protein n=1 Tax=Streptococcus mitis TaxID=28037 RepID=A0A081SCB5_STRMT|nr:hypothetical protein SK137_0723 [Streptococcus mitis]KER08568.1 hypothetical protein SK271_0611 [Streptococcus mitis]